MPPDADAALSALSDWLATHAGVTPALVVLVLARASGLAWTAPALSTAGLGARFRLVLAAALGVIAVPAAAASVAEFSALNPAWPLVAGGCLVEAVVGAGLGWSAALVVAGARQAGEVVGAQAGFSAAALIDPDAGDDLTAVGHLYGLVALGVFLALDGPLAVAHALAGSYAMLPAGCGMGSGGVGGVPALTPGLAREAFGRVGEALALSLRAAAPVAVALTVAGLAVGLISRAAPSIQRAALAVPLRAALGLVAVLLGLATLAATLAASWSAWPESAWRGL